MVKSKSSETKENTYLFCWIYPSLVMFVKDHSTANAVSTNMQELNPLTPAKI